MRWKAAFATLVASLVSACSPVTVLNTLAPSNGIVERQDIPYADGPRHMLDVYAPSTSSEATTHPVVVFIYGGNWEDGNRGMYRFVGAALAARGIVTVIPDYRVYPEVVFPGFVQDAAQAVAWARAHVGAYGGDPHRLFVMGHSAGAHIAALLALDGEYLEANGMTPRDLAGVIGLAGPYDFLPLTDPTLKIIFGPDDQEPRSQPINYVGKNVPPMFLATGSDDDTVEPRNTQSLAAKLRQSGDSVTTMVYSSVGHRTLIGAFSTPLSFLAPVRADVLRFITTQREAGEWSSR